MKRGSERSVQYVTLRGGRAEVHESVGRPEVGMDDIKGPPSVAQKADAVLALVSMPGRTLEISALKSRFSALGGTFALGAWAE